MTSEQQSIIVCGGIRFVATAREYLGACSQACAHEFLAAADCRKYINQNLSANILVLVGPGTNDAAPINLVAALRKDLFIGEILLVNERFNGSFASRAQIAGANTALCIDTLDQVLKEHFGITNSETGCGFAVAVISARGGCGKTCIAVGFAYTALKLGLKVALVDFDFQFGGALDCVGIEAPLELLSCLDNKGKKIASFLMAKNVVTAGFDAYVASSKPYVGEQFMSHASDLLVELREAYDVIVVDTGSYWNDSLAQLFNTTSSVLCVSHASAGSIRATQQAIEVLTKLGLPKAKLRHVLNKTNQKRGLSAVDAAVALRVEDVFDVQDGGRIVTDMSDVGCYSELFALQNNAAKSIASLSRTYLEQEGVQFEEAKPQLFKKRRRLHAAL